MCTMQADISLWNGRSAEGRAAVIRGLAAVAGATLPHSVLWLCSVGLSVEADLAEQARARRDDASLETAMDTGRRLVERARGAVEEIGDDQQAAALLVRAEAEWSRVTGDADARLWAAAGDAWAAIPVPFNAACCRWRQAEALLAGGGRQDQIEAALLVGWQIAGELGAARLKTQIESLARRARIDLPAAPGQTSATPMAPDPARAFGLTPREREVLSLLADGRTNRQIAGRLYISDKTASVHVSNILNKLGVTNRGEAAAVAHRIGLAG